MEKIGYIFIMIIFISCVGNKNEEKIKPTQKLNQLVDVIPFKGFEDKVNFEENIENKFIESYLSLELRNKFSKKSKFIGRGVYKFGEYKLFSLFEYDSLYSKSVLITFDSNNIIVDYRIFNLKDETKFQNKVMIQEVNPQDSIVNFEIWTFMQQNQSEMPNLEIVNKNKEIQIGVINSKGIISVEKWE